ncbi:unnamed protein product [Darwinula stevensoni]|uniref:Uncharacterized protein n=1 Tax=Darwinula stevensoni TaxID=69355 RepID=A0A7R8X1H1_9CRUS|nr:unnamed protein product [Darwinula stevensoni]CAG0880012.1 unnamed protein product [Darwinula stevensoni]
MVQSGLQQLYDMMTSRAGGKDKEMNHAITKKSRYMLSVSFDNLEQGDLRFVDMDFPEEPYYSFIGHDYKQKMKVRCLTEVKIKAKEEETEQIKSTRAIWKAEKESRLPHGLELLSAFVKNDTLSTSVLTKAMRGIYTCEVLNETGCTLGHAKLVIHVRSLWDALWPFIGILGQVVILTAFSSYMEYHNNQKVLDPKNMRKRNAGMGEGIQAHPPQLPIGEILPLQEAFISGSSIDVLEPDRDLTPKETLFCSGMDPLASNIETRQNTQSGMVVLNKPYGLLHRPHPETLKQRRKHPHLYMGTRADDRFSIEACLPDLAASLQIGKLHIAKSIDRQGHYQVLYNSGIVVMTENERLVEEVKQQLKSQPGSQFVVALGQLSPPSGKLKVGLMLEEDPKDQSMRRPVVVESVPLRKVKQGLVVPVKLQYHTVRWNPDLGVSLVCARVKVTRWRALPLLMSHLLTPVLGDPFYGSRVTRVMGVPVKLPAHHSATNTPQTLSDEIVQALSLPKNFNELLPMHIHMGACILTDMEDTGPEAQNPITIIAPPPPHFQWTYLNLGQSQSDPGIDRPSGKRFCSKQELMRFFGDAIDLANFEYSSGKIVHPQFLKRGRGRPPSTKPNTAPQPTVEFTYGLRSEASLIPPIRQTASIFKQPVTVIKSSHGGSIRTDIKPVSVDKPQQIFWQKRLEGMRACNVLGQEIQEMELPKKLKPVGGNIKEQTALQSLATSLHTSTQPITGQTSSKAALDKNPAIYLNPQQPLIQAFIFEEADIREQEEAVLAVRKKLAKALES